MGQDDRDRPDGLAAEVGQDRTEELAARRAGVDQHGDRAAALVLRIGNLDGDNDVPDCKLLSLLVVRLRSVWSPTMRVAPCIGKGKAKLGRHRTGVLVRGAVGGTESAYSGGAGGYAKLGATSSSHGSAPELL